MTPNNDLWLDDLWAEIHFKENSIPSVHAGKLTDKTKQAIQAHIDSIVESVISTPVYVSRDATWSVVLQEVKEQQRARYKKLKGEL